MGKEGIYAVVERSYVPEDFMVWYVTALGGRSDAAHLQQRRQQDRKGRQRHAVKEARRDRNRRALEREVPYRDRPLRSMGVQDGHRKLSPWRINGKT